MHRTYTKNNPHDPAPNRTGFFCTEIMRLLGPNYARSMAVENRDISGTVPERPRLSREMGTGHGREKVHDDCLAERGGFEPPRHLLSTHTISSRAPSANSDTSP